MKPWRLIVAVLLLPSSLSLAAASATATPYPHTHLPLFDLPFQAETHFSYFSMHQSLALTETYYDWIHWGEQYKLGLDPYAPGVKGFLNNLAYILGDWLVWMAIPPGESWEHEEWHRAVMAHRGVSSYNDVYKFNIGAQLINVSHENDDDLARLKREHNEDQVRLAEAGMEGELAMIGGMQKEDFFHDSPSYHVPLYWIATISVTQYLATCAGSEADALTDDANKKEKTIPERDFIGLDCDAWIRDLNRPNEPYAARGVHPTGIGINRYTRWSDLTPSEKSYLKQASQLTYLNVLNPFLFGFKAWRSSGWFGEGQAESMANLAFNLTSFGTDASLNTFYKSARLAMQTQLHLYHNAREYFPGLEWDVFDIPLNARNSLSTEAALWQQPHAFRFHTARGDAGGRIAVQWDYKPAGMIQPFLKAAWKSQGWYQGEVDQDPGLTVLAGITIDPNRSLN